MKLLRILQKRGLKQGSILLSCLLFMLASSTLFAQTTMYSSVSPEFPNGLHAKYLRYIADKMAMELDIMPMPFARRIRALRQGKIDLMVGMQKENASSDDIIYILPAYEKLRHSFFVLQNSQQKLTRFEDLNEMTIGVTIHAKYYKHFQEQQNLALIAVSTLKQKVDLLLKGRIDTFIHYQESTEPYLKKHDLDNKVILASYQPTENHEYYVTISEKSRLFPYQEKLRSILEKALENGDFEQIRNAHYAL
jgi:polar amino acid transport system substrate-binding protein